MLDTMQMKIDFLLGKKYLGGYMKVRLVVISILIIFAAMLQAQTGKIAGKISNAETGDAIEGVSVFLEDSQTGTYSKVNGTYQMLNVAAGEHTVHVRFMGYEQMESKAIVKSNETVVVNFQLKRSAVEIEGLSVTANRAIARETPVSFTDISEEIIKEKYTTGDMPQMLDDIPGLFATTSGMGEAEITMRGFDAQKIQILINGIPVNDPESQVVYWSNWTGLSSNVKSVQVQRGAGASLYGSGAFGGSVNIETMGSANESEFTIRNSTGYYTTDGKSATELGEMKDYTPINYNASIKYSSGKLFNDKFKFDVSVERKAGNYYVRGTEYDGWSYGLELENKLSNHVINTSFIYAPQKHNQARSTYDPELGKILGREFNFTNHKWQENKYLKPQLSIRDRWSFSPNSYLMTNLFLTSGKGGGSYANNIIFDASSGALLNKERRTEKKERQMFGKYAYLVYKETGYLIEGLEIDETTGYGNFTWAGDDEAIYVGTNTFDGDQYHTSKKTSYNNHNQIGLNSYFEKDVTDNINVIIGGEGRLWNADHYKEGSDLIYFNPEDPDSVSTLGTYMRDYDYSSLVMNTSGFARAKINIPFDSVIQNINLMLDGQYAIYHSEVEENLIKFYDPIADKYINEGYYISKTDSIDVTVYDANGDSTEVRVLKFEDDDYKRTFDFFSPKFGINVNINDYWNVLANYSIVYKEPRVTDWYDRDIGSNQMGGPGVKQADAYGNILYDIVPEKGQTIEGGFGFKKNNIKIDATYYHTKYTDKIERADIGPVGQTKTATLNVGEALHQGVEFSVQGDFGYFDYNASTTFSRNRWEDLNDNYQEIFFEKAEDVEGKVVPYSPEKMASGGVGYTFQEMPLNGSLRIGLSCKWTDDYYTTYDNLYCKQLYFFDADSNFVSIGEHKYVENLDGTGGFSYNEEADEYVTSNNQGDWDREWIMRSSKLPAFFELNGSLSYKFNIGDHEAAVKLNVNNIMNKDDNYSKAYIIKAYGMKIKQADGSFIEPTFGEGANTGTGTDNTYYPYLSPSPLLNIFLTLEYKF
jgi:outer membrane receptor protein involved in Fe transport